MSDIHKHYKHLDDKEREATDTAYTMIQSFFKELDILTRGDDRAERLVDAISKYIMECKRTDIRQIAVPHYNGGIKHSVRPVNAHIYEIHGIEVGVWYNLDNRKYTVSETTTGHFIMDDSEYHEALIIAKKQIEFHGIEKTLAAIEAFRRQGL